MLCPSCHTDNAPSAATCAKCRTALPRGAEGSVIGGRYEVRSCLGKGGMGVVYKAYDRVLEETVAIKVLLDRDADDTGAATRRFRSEIKTARKVTHRNVCRIHDYGEDGGQQYISMQYVEGSDLRDRVRGNGGLPAGQAYDVALQIAEGLQAIHDEGIVHRDLKTANVMIDAQGVVRLMDFGIAKDTAGGESLTVTGLIVGTPEYMSPEQIRGEELDARSDLYSLGVILFELFTGRVPFTASSAVALLMKHLHEQPPLDDAAAAAIPPAVREVIGRALAKDREARYGSARDVAEALRAARAAGDRGALRTASVPPAPLSVPAPPGPAHGTSREPPPAAPLARGRRRNVAWALLALPIVLLGAWAALRALDVLIPRSPTGDETSGAAEAPPTTMARAVVASSPRSGAPPVAPTPAPAPRTCDEGNAADCTRLGVLHNTGRGVEKDVATAAAFYEKGCQGGHAQGCNNLGTLYEFGLIGFGADPVQAAGLYRRGCDQGDAQACGNLGVVSLTHAPAGGSGREEAILATRQGCAAGLDRACRKLRELGLAP